MDRVIEKKKWSAKRITRIAIAVGIIGLTAAAVYFSTGKSRLSVDQERLVIGEIKKGTFQEFIPLNGVVLPQTSIYLDAIEGGRVEEEGI